MNEAVSVTRHCSTASAKGRNTDIWFNDSKFLRARYFLYSRESKCAVFSGISVMIQSLEIN